MQNQIFQAPGIRSTFVSVIAWLFIVGAGFLALISLMQNIMINVMFSNDLPIPPDHGAEQVPAVFRFMFSHIRFIFFAFLALSVGTLIAAIGLLRRKHWARIAFIGLFAFGIVWNIAGLGFQWLIFSSMSSMSQANSNAPVAFDETFNQITTVMQIFSAIMAIGFAILFGWLIKRFLSEPIRAEFNQVR